MRNGHNKDAPGPLRRAEGKPTSYPGLFQGPKRLGHQLYKRESWRRPIVSSIMDPAVTILPRKRSALPQLGREEASCRGARHDESFGRPSDICLRDRVGHGDRAGGSEAANLIEASREGAWGCGCRAPSAHHFECVTQDRCDASRVPP